MQKDRFTLLFNKLLSWRDASESFFGVDAVKQFATKVDNDQHTARKLNAAFLIASAGEHHPHYPAAADYLNTLAREPNWQETAQFYLDGLRLVPEEMSEIYRNDPSFAHAIDQLLQFLQQHQNTETNALAEKVYAVFFPEALGLTENPAPAIEALRNKRTVTITELNQQPIFAPHRQMLFTGNALLTIPAPDTNIEELPYSQYLKDALTDIIHEPQLYWYDHPVQIGVKPSNNEILYGLRGLDQTIAFEKDRRNIPARQKVTCLLSVSVTHEGLQQIAGNYIKEELGRNGSLQHIDLYVFTEADTRQIIKSVLEPAARRFMDGPVPADVFHIFGVDGEYGRHYSFLKAIAAFWQVFIDRQVKATFKIDLDQVFPQENLVQETGHSAFEHFTTPLWGATGYDHHNRPVELSMIAGALVNKSDVHKSLFTPDVPIPTAKPTADERIFHSRLPQAVSTRAEMMTRYNHDHADGKRTCIQRVHVTGGTNGIRIDALFDHCPFTPSFMGRAEDQAYLFSVLFNEPRYLSYLHKPGLIMRHDKASFAADAIQHARTGKWIGDYIRILYFSEYGRVVSQDLASLKDRIDPFTGCFVSKIPLSVVYLRFALKAATLFEADRWSEGYDFIRSGIPRILKAFDFTMGTNSKLKSQYQSERRAWHIYYRVLQDTKAKMASRDPFALEIATQAQQIIEQCRYPTKDQN
ncbi:MAG: hypothetical protein GF313_13950 [Caldithrix sp.]|nr:hypothetical protein [Caldithrix sp.]